VSDDVDRRSVLIGLGVAAAAGIAGFVGFSVAGPTPGDDDRRDGDRRDDDRPADERRDDEGREDVRDDDPDHDDDRSGSNRGKG
jgi:hypothetical protein